MVLGGILAWTVFAFGGVYPATLAAPAVACLALAIAFRPSVLESASTPQLDLWIFLVLAAATLQVVPLPHAVVGVVSPSAETVARRFSLVDSRGPLALSIDGRSSAAALLVLAAGCLLFFTARQMFARSGVRTTARIVSVIGLVVSAIALAQDATGHGMMYWRWRPLQEGPAPFGPFINRNHFATWAMMAAPLCAGYLTAHAAAHHGAGRDATWQRKLMTAIDPRAWLLVASAAIMAVAITASLSRSGLVGLFAALVCGGLLFRRRARDAEGLQLEAAPLVSAGPALSPTGSSSTWSSAPRSPAVGRSAATRS
ncbi:MAG: hypothetical protein ABJC89_15150, partial [Acidobacteriota bacterium]